jgi:hypothetical protein
MIVWIEKTFLVMMTQISDALLKCSKEARSMASRIGCFGRELRPSEAVNQIRYS